jgi:AcrR family transcriptional regulator
MKRRLDRTRRRVAATEKRRAKPRRTRAIDETAKQQRRTALLIAAERLFSTRDYAMVSVNDVARAAGLAKGTVYLYFRTKEALFLELVAEGLAGWVRDTARSLTQRSVTPQEFASILATTLTERPTLIRLLGLLHAVLEDNTDADGLRMFKRRLLQITFEAGRVFESVLPLRPPTSGARVVLWMHAVIVGLAQMSSPSETLAELLKQDEALAMFRLDFQSELQLSLAVLFAGVTQGKQHGE